MIYTQHIQASSRRLLCRKASERTASLLCEPPLLLLRVFLFISFSPYVHTLYSSQRDGKRVAPRRRSKLALCLAASEIFTSKVGAQPAQNLFKQKRRERKIKIGALLLNQHFKRDLFLASGRCRKRHFPENGMFCRSWCCAACLQK